MRRNSSILLVVGLALGMSASAVAAAEFAGPSRGITGNDTGGIFPYSPAVEHDYQRIAADYCARWRRLAHVTSVHRRYGDYVSFVCIDKPWMIH
jgi:hypothetical protein